MNTPFFDEDAIKAELRKKIERDRSKKVNDKVAIAANCKKNLQETEILIERLEKKKSKLEEEIANLKRKIVNRQKFLSDLV